MITQEIARDIAICYEQIERSEKAIKILEKGIQEKGENYEIEEIRFDEKTKKKPFELQIKNENGSYSVIETDANISLKMANAVRKENKKTLKKLTKEVFELFNSEKIKGKKISKKTAIEIHNCFANINRAEKFRDEIIKKLEEKTNLELELRENSFASNVTFAIPLTWSENGRDLKGVPADLTKEILENYVTNKKNELKEAQIEAKKELGLVCL